MDDLPTEQGPTDDVANQEQQVLQPSVVERLAIVRIGNDLLGAPGRHSKEIVQIASFTPLPRAPFYLLGITNLRGDILPLLDLSSILGGRRASQSFTRQERLLALVVEATEMRVALAIDEIMTFEPVALDDERHPLNESMQARFGALASGALQHPLGQIVLLDIPQLVDTLRIHRQTQARQTDVA